MDEFMAIPNHINFRAKKLFGEVGQIIDGSIAYIDVNGGGPVERHTHVHNHLFIVVEGEVKMLLGDQEVIVKQNESYFVKGDIPHAVWNNAQGKTVMIGISVK